MVWGYERREPLPCLHAAPGLCVCADMIPRRTRAGFLLAGSVPDAKHSIRIPGASLCTGDGGLSNQTVD